MPTRRPARQSSLSFGSVIANRGWIPERFLLDSFLSQISYGSRSRLKTNKSKFAVLGLLALGPGSGYDIKKLVGRLLAHFWSESYGQIYPILKQLSTEGLAVRKTQRQRGKPDRQIYTITKKGLDLIDEWLSEPTQIQVPRNETLLRVSLGQLVSAAETLAQIERYRDHHLQNLQACSELEAAIREEFEDAPQLPFWLLTVSHEKHISRATIRWCDEARKVLQSESGELEPAGRNATV